MSSLYYVQRNTAKTVPTEAFVGSADTITDGFERIQSDDKVGVCITYFNPHFSF
jgi:hypothetical protein